MSLIDSTYFVKDILLPTSKYNSLDTYIAKYEPRIIMDLFGHELGALVLAYDAATSPQEIKDIVEGKEYTSSYAAACGYYNPGGEPFKVKWNGLKNTDKVSLIAYWVYYWWLKENSGYLTLVGGAKSKKENATDEGYNAKAVYAWNKMVFFYGYEGQPVVEPSCYNFMYEHKDTYPSWVFKYQQKINRFGI